MERDAFEGLLRKGLNKLYKQDPDLVDKKFNINERTITFRLGIYLAELYSDLDVDCEYNRMVNHNGNYTEGDYWAKTINLKRDDYISDEDDEAKTVFPDIIIHKRKSPENLAVIEVKIKWKNSRKDFDYKKLKAYKKDLHYKYAVFLEIGQKDYFLDFL